MWPDGQFAHAQGSNGFSGCAVDQAATIDEAPLPRAVLCRDGHRELTRGHNDSSVNAAAYKRMKISRERGGEAAVIHNFLAMYTMSVSRQRTRTSRQAVGRRDGKFHPVAVVT